MPLLPRARGKNQVFGLVRESSIEQVIRTGLAMMAIDFDLSLRARLCLLIHQRGTPDRDSRFFSLVVRPPTFVSFLSCHGTSRVSENKAVV